MSLRTGTKVKLVGTVVDHHPSTPALVLVNVRDSKVWARESELEVIIEPEPTWSLGDLVRVAKEVYVYVPAHVDYDGAASWHSLTSNGCWRSVASFSLIWARGEIQIIRCKSLDIDEVV